MNQWSGPFRQRVTKKVGFITIDMNERKNHITSCILFLRKNNFVVIFYGMCFSRDELRSKSNRCVDVIFVSNWGVSLENVGGYIFGLVQASEL